MPATNIATNVMPADDLAALDAALADFDLDGGDTDEVVELAGAEDITAEIIEETVEEDAIVDLTLAEVEAAASGVIDEETLADLDMKLEVQEGYQEQAAAGSIENLEDAIKAGEKPAKAPRQARAPREKKEGTTRVPRDINTVAPEFFVLSGDPATMDPAALEAAKVDTLALKPGQVKIAEKFENLFTAISVGKQPSRFTKIAFDFLNGKGSMTSTDLVGAYKTAGLGEGTARSQAGQMMNLFAAIGIADRVAQTLTLRADSLVAARLRSLPAAAAE